MLCHILGVHKTNREKQLTYGLAPSPDYADLVLTHMHTFSDKLSRYFFRSGYETMFHLYAVGFSFKTWWKLEAKVSQVIGPHNTQQCLGINVTHHVESRWSIRECIALRQSGTWHRHRTWATTLTVFGTPHKSPWSADRCTFSLSNGQELHLFLCVSAPGLWPSLPTGTVGFTCATF